MQGVNFFAHLRSGMAMPEIYAGSRRAAYSDRKGFHVRGLLSRQHLAEAMHI
jgi:hypothetical protein